MTTPYQKHKHKWRKCTKCVLCEQRRKVVLARGILPCDVLLVGEAPGVSEDIIGKPFCGPAGKLLDRVISQGFDGQVDYAITNLVACYPKEAKASGDGEPPREAMVACQDRLREFHNLCNPKQIVCVGTLAQKWLPKALTGVWLGMYTDMLHPAAILRLDASQRPLAIKRSIVILEEVAANLDVPF